MPVSTASGATLYELRDKLIMALQAVEQQVLSMNPALAANCDARLTAAVPAMTAQVGSGVSTTALVADTAAVTLKNSAGTIVGTAGAAAVAGGALSSVNAPASTALVPSATKIVATVTGTYVNGFTPTVTNGVITSIVLS